MGREHSRTGKLLHILLALALTLPSGCSLFRETREPVTEEKKVQETPVPEEQAQVQPEKAEAPEKIAEAEPKEAAEDRKRREIESSLFQAKDLLAKGDFEGSLRESQRALSLSDKNSSGDEALFTMALVYAHPKNQRKDYKKCTSLLRRILKEYPRSTVAEEARIWISVLQTIEQSKQVDAEIEEMKRELSR